MRFFKILLLTVLGALIAAETVRAQSARSILDKTATKLKGSGGLQATFEATTFKGLSPQGTAVGTIRVQGNRFQIDSDQMFYLTNRYPSYQFEVSGSAVEQKITDLLPGRAYPAIILVSTSSIFANGRLQ